MGGESQLHLIGKGGGFGPRHALEYRAMALTNNLEKLGLLALAGMSTAALAVIAVLALRAGTVDPNASTLIGVIAGGLIAIGKDIVQAIRGYAMSAQLGKVTDQLAASGPVPDTPQPVVMTNQDDDPVPVDAKNGGA